MPELPEVETIRRQLQKALVSKKIRSVLVYLDKMVFTGAAAIPSRRKGSKPASRKFAALLKGRKITAVSRRAKYLIMELSGGVRLVSHLRMSGQLIYLSKSELKNPLLLSLAKKADKQTLPSKHTHIEIILSDNGKLFYNDTRQFGYLQALSEKEFQKYSQNLKLGPEPLEISESEFRNLAKKFGSKRAKSFLLDQKAIAGIGNIYADESLFISRIRPDRKMHSLSKKEASALRAAIVSVLKRAISEGGSSIENFISINGASGNFAEHHLVYGKAGKPCPNCGLPLKSAKMASRTTVFCAKCQK